MHISHLNMAASLCAILCLVTYVQAVTKTESQQAREVRATYTPPFCLPGEFGSTRLWLALA